MNTPFSVHIVTAMEWILGFWTGIYCLMFFVFGFYGALHLDVSRTISSLGVAVLMGALTVALLLIGQALRSGRRWAWKASWGVGAVVMLFGGWVVIDPHYAKVHSTDDYFGIIVGPFLMLCALLGFVLIAVPQTRRHFTDQ